MVDAGPQRYGGAHGTAAGQARSWQVDERAALDRILDVSDPGVPDARRVFHTDLDAIDDAFVTAGLQVAEAMPRMAAAFLAGDRSVMAEAEALAITTSDTCELVEEAGFVLLARQAPVSGDLRRLVALLRMTVDVHRSASLLRHACLTLKTFDPRFLVEPLRSQLAELAMQACSVFAAGVDAWRRRDALAVTDVDLRDEAVDELQVVLLRETQRGGDDVGEGMLVLGLLARYFERIADHGVEIARDAAFVATGQRIRVGRRRLEQLPTDRDGASESDDVSGDARGGAPDVDADDGPDPDGVV